MSLCLARKTLAPVHQCACLRQEGHRSDGESIDGWHLCKCGTKWSDERELDVDTWGEGKLGQIIRLPSTPPVDPELTVNVPYVPDLTPYTADIVRLMSVGTVCDCDDYDGEHPSHELLKLLVNVAVDFHRKGRAGQ